MPAFIPILIMVVVFSLIGRSGKNTRKRAEAAPRPQSVNRAAEHWTAPAPARPVPVSEPEKEEDFCQASGFEEGEGWDSELEFHEGEEDPEHDHGGFMGEIESSLGEHRGDIPQMFAYDKENEASGTAREMLRGVIWSEVLSRRTYRRK